MAEVMARKVQEHEQLVCGVDTDEMYVSVCMCVILTMGCVCESKLP